MYKQVEFSPIAPALAALLLMPVSAWASPATSAFQMLQHLSGPARDFSPSKIKGRPIKTPKQAVRDSFRSETFSLTTRDGTAQLNGQIDFPLSASGKPPLVVMFPGSGLFDRDVYFGVSETERDFFFLELSKRLTAQGIAVLRADYRGITCTMRSFPPERRSEFYKKCLDRDVRANVDKDTMQADFKQLFEYGKGHEEIDSDRVAILAHSEGTLHTSRMIGRDAIDPYALIYLGALMESPKASISWQMVDRWVDIFMGFDADEDNILTNEEFSAGIVTSPIPVPRWEYYLSPDGFWTYESLYAFLKKDYDKRVEDTLALPDDAQCGPAPGLWSCRWWKNWFKDDKILASGLTRFEGPMLIINGTADTQTPGIRQFKVLKEWEPKMRTRPEAILLEGLGHGLGTHPTMGPMKDSVAQDLTARIKTLLTRE